MVVVVVYLSCHGPRLRWVTGRFLYLILGCQASAAGMKTGGVGFSSGCGKDGGIKDTFYCTAYIAVHTGAKNESLIG